MNIKDEANAYEPVRTLNVADLKSVPVEIELHDGSGEADGKEFTYKYIIVEEQKYRVPGTVLGGIKALLTKMPNMKAFSVLKSGSGLNTRYQVIPYQE